MCVKKGLILCLFIYLCSACEQAKLYRLAELEENHYNTLELPVQHPFEADDYQQLFKKFQAMDQEQLIAQLETANLELHQASFGFYYLANAYAANKDLKKTLKYHTIAAQDYLNPQSLLKLAEINFHVHKDYAKAYEYLHQSSQIKVEITENNHSHPIARNGKEKTNYLLQELEKIGNNNGFNKAAVRAKLKAELPDLLNTYRTIYGLGPREGAQ